ncbi:NAD(P)-dependent oxidoreductase [Polynucleobacter sp. 73C-SIWE]|uniref:SDR family oxidoreductase n=1 Tax=Polynucleobacter sp. 73C-SIWE TaxID=2689098 RepID=UPI001C0D2678|nr:NAD(P)-dependent oxidoreductase [Polynucleobacter sp. 73C-SIWE]MBU3580226.1 NAD(P)-dependent oxidoreductase [Polynucleobacter sp. 73C-SIWE]
MKKNILLVGGCGYIGTFLYEKLLENNCSITVCDILKRGNPLNIDLINKDYALLEERDLQHYDTVLWFAGHSSVSLSTEDPEGALKNNCLNLYSFAKKLPEKTKFIYASSASLYSKKSSTNIASTEDSLVTIPSQNPYDISKFAFDYIAKGFLNNFYGLRMGTLSGYSPNLRPELVFNAMNISAKKNGYITLKNAESNRTILLLEDLWILIRELIFSTHKPGFINVGSINCNLGQLANQIREVWGSNIIDNGVSETYSFTLDTSMMKNICGADLKARDFGKDCHELLIKMESKNG